MTNKSYDESPKFPWICQECTGTGEHKPNCPNVRDIEQAMRSPGILTPAQKELFRMPETLKRLEALEAEVRSLTAVDPAEMRRMWQSWMKLKGGAE